MLSTLTTLICPLACPKLSIHSPLLPKVQGLCQTVHQIVSRFTPSQLFYFQRKDQKYLQTQFFTVTQKIENFRKSVEKMGYAVESKLIPSMTIFGLQNLNHSEDNVYKPFYLPEMEIIHQSLKFWEENCETRAGKINVLWDSDTKNIVCSSHNSIEELNFESLSFTNQIFLLNCLLREIESVFRCAEDQIDNFHRNVTIAKNVTTTFWPLLAKWKKNEYFSHEMALDVFSAIRKNVCSTVIGYKIAQKMASESRYFLSHAIHRLKVWLGEIPSRKIPSLKLLDVKYVSCYINSVHEENWNTFFRAEVNKRKKCTIFCFLCGKLHENICFFTNFRCAFCKT